MENARNKIVRAIDLGYGFTKIVKSVDARGTIKTYSFPSIATHASKKTLGGGFLKERDTTEIVHNGVTFEVGKDVVLSTNAYSNRILNKNYTSSDDYNVLMKGALKMMNTSHIDILVIGTPVSNHDSVKKQLQNTWRGVIDLDGKNKVTIEKVVVLPQPLGGLAYYGNDKKIYDVIRRERNLIIDPGYFTFDWLLVDNMKLMQGSNSYEGGMSFVINAIVKELGQDLNNLTTITRIDEYFYDNKPFKLDGEIFDLTPFVPVGNSIIEKAVQTMITNIGDIRNIDNIIVIGGAAQVYYPIIQKYLKEREIKIARGKSFSNVLGYYFIGYKSIK